MAIQTDKNGQNIGIGWCDATINLWWGCTKVHTGCDNCYAERNAKRWGRSGIWGRGSSRLAVKSAFRELERINATARSANTRAKVFIGSMMDIFENPMPLVSDSGLNADPYSLSPTMYEISQSEAVCRLPKDDTRYPRALLFEAIKRGIFDSVFFLFLTKRAPNAVKFAKEIVDLPNVAFGFSVSDQPTYENMLTSLERISDNGGKCFLSIEPQVGPICLTKTKGIGWVIQGGESGPKKRPFYIDWAYSMMHQCDAMGIPFFFKQIDKVQEPPFSLRLRKDFPCWTDRKTIKEPCDAN